MNIKTVFASRLKQLRDEKGLSQSELGEQLGVSRGTISFYESQKRTADIEFLAAAAQFFEVDYDFLMGVSNARVEKNEAQKTLNSMGLSDIAISMVTEANKIFDGVNPANILFGCMRSTAFLSNIMNFLNYEYSREKFLKKPLDEQQKIKRNHFDVVDEVSAELKTTGINSRIIEGSDLSNFYLFNIKHQLEMILKNYIKTYIEEMNNRNVLTKEGDTNGNN